VARHRGMSLVVAIFLITIIASLAAFAVSVGTATRETENLQLQADRAMAAARAGSEWASYRALVQLSCPGIGSPTAFNLTQGALRGFRVTVTCEPFPGHIEVGLPLSYNVYDIVSTAQWSNFGAADYAYRQVTTRVSTAP
jgi:MSHA biogenesis protein MshP